MKQPSSIPRDSGNRKSPVRAAVQSILCCLLLFADIYALPALAQQLSKTALGEPSIHGIVLDAQGRPVDGAKVHLESGGGHDSEERVTDEQGMFAFPAHNVGTYSLTAEKLGKHSASLTSPPTTTPTGKDVELVLNQEGPYVGTPATSKPPSLEAIQFADQPNFTVAGVTDFTAAGGHGSDSSLRTSEALARETSTLKPGGVGGDSNSVQASSDSEERLRTAVAEAPASFDANHRLGEYYLHAGRSSEALPLLQTAYLIDKTNHENEYDLALACAAIGDPAHASKYVQELLNLQESAELHRLAGELDESLGNSLAAVREYQKAVSLDPAERNFFSWASELLLHRAIWQAQQVFEEGAKLYPSSSRMVTGLGTALFAGAAYDEAAAKLCQASDMNPSAQEPYVFLGKVQMAAPDRLSCIEPRLRRFVQQQPGSATANYLYAMALEKGHANTAAVDDSQQPEVFLRKAIGIDPSYADAHLQLGILYASRKNYDQAIVFYSKAIAADPQLSDAYYRLAVAYDRTGQPAKAKEEFRLHDEVARKQAAETERQRQEVKQFLIVLAPDVNHPPTP